MICLVVDHSVPILGVFQHSDPLGYMVSIDADQNAVMDIIAVEDPVLLIHGLRNLMRIVVGYATNGQGLGGGFLDIRNAAVMDEDHAMIITVGAVNIAVEEKISARFIWTERVR